MSRLEVRALDECALSPESVAFAQKLFARFPEFRRHAAMQRSTPSNPWGLVVEVSAPSGDAASLLTVWVDFGDEPSVAFGRWHTHAGFWVGGGPDADEDLALLELVEAILADRIVACEDIRDPPSAAATALDPTAPDELLEWLTSKHSSGSARIRSWSGRLDRVVTLDSFLA